MCTHITSNKLNVHPTHMNKIKTETLPAMRPNPSPNKFISNEEEQQKGRGCWYQMRHDKGAIYVNGGI